MAKTLLNRIGKRTGRAICIATVGLFLYGCPCPIPDPNPGPIPPRPPDPSVPVITLPDDIAFIEGKEYAIDLSTYKDDKGNTITGEEISSYDTNIISPALSGNGKQLTINVTNNVSQDLPSHKILDLKFKDDVTGKENIASLEGKIENLTDISGTIESDEPGVQSTGAANVYDANDPKFIAQNPSDPPTPIGQTTSDINGNLVPFQLNKRVSQVVLRAKFTPKGFVREIVLDGTKDYNLTHKIIVVPYEAGWDDNRARDFIEHMGRTNFWSDAERAAKGITGGVTGNPWNGLKKWNRGELPDDINHPVFRGIEISSNDFTELEYNQTKTIIQNSSCPGANQIQVVWGESHDGENGWGRIVLGNGSNSPGTMVWDQNGVDGYIEGFKTYLTHIQIVVDYLINHEIHGHGRYFPGHADGPSIAALFYSIMKYANLNPPNDFTPIDIKGSYIVDKYPGMESESKILGMIF